MPSADVCLHSEWNILSYLYKLRLIKLFYKVFSGEAPTALSYLLNKPCAAYDFRRSNKITVPHFNSYFLKTQLAREVPFYGMLFLHILQAPNLRLFTIMQRRINTLSNLILVHSQFSRFPDNNMILSAISHLFIVLIPYRIIFFVEVS